MPHGISQCAYAIGAGEIRSSQRASRYSSDMVASQRIRLFKRAADGEVPGCTALEIPASLMVHNRMAESLRPAFRNIETLRIEYEAKQPAIEARLEEFRRTGRERDERLFEELCFCLIAVQSKARTSDAAVAAL